MPLSMTVAGIWRSSPAQGRAAMTSMHRSQRGRRTAVPAGAASGLDFSMDSTSVLSTVTVAYLRRTTRPTSTSWPTTPSRVPPFLRRIVSAETVPEKQSSPTSVHRFIVVLRINSDYLTGPCRTSYDNRRTSGDKLDSLHEIHPPRRPPPDPRRGRRRRLASLPRALAERRQRRQF